MTKHGTTRRCFLGAAAAGVAGHMRAEAKHLRLGGPVFLKTDDPGELAREHTRLGYRAAYCPSVKLNDAVRLEAIRKAFREQDVIIAEVGAFGSNMLDADPRRRKAKLESNIGLLALADAAGALNCVDIPGTFNPTVWDGPDPRNYSKEFFDATVENCRKVIDGAKPKHAKFTLEMMPWSIPDGPDNYLELLKAIDRPAFGVHIDICNAINSTQRYFRNAELIEECFRKLGRWVASCHAKDLGPRSVHLAETVPGRGGIDYRAYVTAIATYAPGAPLMMEHMAPQDYKEAQDYIVRKGAEAGISFS